MERKRLEEEIISLRWQLEQLAKQLQRVNEKLVELEEHALAGAAPEEKEEAATPVEPAFAETTPSKPPTIPPPLPPTLAISDQEKIKPAEDEKEKAAPEEGAPEEPAIAASMEQTFTTDATESVPDWRRFEAPEATGVMKEPAEEDQPPKPPWKPWPFLKPLINWFKPKPGETLSWDEVLVGRIFPIIGVIVTLLACVFLATFIGPRMTEWHRVAVMYLGAFVLGGLGIWLHGKYPDLARPMIAGGIAGFYFTSYAAHFIEYTEVMGLAFSITLMTVATALLIGLAERFKSELI
ncbi:unnamed protein product, partial [marine sediment metagenome]